MTITRTELVQPVAAFEPLTRGGQPRRDAPGLDGQTAVKKEAAQRPDESLRAAQHETRGAASGASTDQATKTVKLPDFPLRELAFRLDPDTRRVVVQVIDSKTKTVLHQYPPEESIQLLKQLRTTRGLILDKTI